MRIAIYNQMFGLDGRSFFSNILGHYFVHFQKDSKKALNRTSIDSTIDIIEKSGADVVGICEVLGPQREEFEMSLKKLGYKWVFFQEGHRTKFNKMAVCVAVASKLKCVKKKMKKFPVKNELGGGGGCIHCFFPEKNINLINVHFAIARQKILIKQQITFLQSHLENLKGCIILLGDFNINYPKLVKCIPQLSKLNLVSNRIKSCSLTPILKLFHFKDDDHMLTNSSSWRNITFLEGISDHRLLSVDLE